MDLLIFCRQYYRGDELKIGHWLDTDYERQIAKIEARGGTYDDVLKAKADIENKRNSRPQPGDILERHDDGWWANAVAKNPSARMFHCYGCVSVPGKEMPVWIGDTDTNVAGKLDYQYRNRFVGAIQAGEHLTLTLGNLHIYDKRNAKEIDLVAVTRG